LMKLRRTKKIVPFILGHPVDNARLCFISVCALETMLLLTPKFAYPLWKETRSQ